MRPVEIVSIQRISAADKARIEAVAPGVHVIDAGGWFDGEIRDTWPAFTAQRYLAPSAAGSGTRTERDALLGGAEIIIGGWPFPLDLRARSPKLKWFHQRPAGASNLRLGDLWGSDVTVTTSRGAANALAMAEYAIAGVLYFAKGFNTAIAAKAAGEFNHRAYRPWLLDGKTLCVVGAGGIGRDVGRLAAGAGFKVIGTRRTPDGSLPPGFQRMGGTGDLDAFLADSDVVVVCCQWTPETTNLINAQRLAAMKPGGILVNVARGEVVDEAAVVEALDRDHLRGVVMDVYVGEFDHGPPARLASDPRVIVTPHISGASDQARHGAIDIFCDNLRAYLDGKPLQNVIDWDRGY